MAKTVSGVFLGVALVSLAILFAERGQAQATPGAGCKQWKVDSYFAHAGDLLPEGWEPFAVQASDRIAIRHCVKD